MRINFKNILILTLVLILVLGCALPLVSFADEMPYSDQYEEVKITVNGKAIDTLAYTCKGNMYVPVSVIKKYGDCSKLSFSSDRVSFDMGELSVNFGSTATNQFIQKYAGSCYIPIKSFKSDYFVSIGPVAQLAKLAWTFTNGKLLLSQYSEATNLATIGRTSGTASSLKNKSIASLSTGERVFIIKESESFYKVETIDGNQYYVNKGEVQKIDDISKINDFEYIPAQKERINRTINMAWLNLNDDATRTPLPPEDPTGIDVMSPVWMHLPVNQNGYVRHLCDYGYVELAHQMGYKVWMCAQNNFMATGSTNYTTEILASEKLRNKVIAQYLVYACLYNLDGINLDFESMVNRDKANFTAFNETLGKYCNDLGITYSIATYPCNASNSNRYDWEALAACSDYLVPMMYSSKESNTVPQSIAGMDWYIQSVGSLASKVPASKIIVGIPFFTRYWYVNENEKIMDASNYKNFTGTISMQTLKQRMDERKYTKTWDEEKKQYVLRYVADNGLNLKTWMEDERSILEKIKYVVDNGFAGTANWELTQGYDGIMELFEKVYKQDISPDVLLEQYKK